MEVLESNALCSLLVLMVKVSKDKSSLLFLLDYGDHTKCLPTRVNVQCEGNQQSPLFPKESTSSTRFLKIRVVKGFTVLFKRCCCCAEAQVKTSGKILGDTRITP